MSEETKEPQDFPSIVPPGVKVQPVIEYEEWEKRGEALFGKDRMKWLFRCPSCGHVTSVQDWQDAGASLEAVAFSCVGRLLGSKQTIGQKDQGQGCNYAGGGLFGLNPVTINLPMQNGTRKPVKFFDFAEPEKQEEPASE